MNNILVGAIMVKNEEERIIRTLNTALPIIDYLVVLDTGSTDKTVEIIKKYKKEIKIPLKLMEEPFKDFSYNRNILLKGCNGLGEFILLLDANDEVRNPKILKEFLYRINKNKKVVALNTRFQWDNMTGVEGFNEIYYKISVIRNNNKEIYYKYPTHEDLITPRKNIISNDLIHTKFEIYQDRSKDKSSFPRFKKDAELLEKYLKENGEDLRIYRYLSQTLGNLKEWKRLLEITILYVKYMEKYRNIYKYNDDIYYGYLYRGKAEYMNETHDIDRKEYPFEKYYVKAGKHSGNRRERCEPYYELSENFSKLGENRLAYKWIKYCCKMEEPKGYEVDKIPDININIYGKLRWNMLIRMMYLNGDVDEYDKKRNELIEKSIYMRTMDPKYDKNVDQIFVPTGMVEKVRKHMEENGGKLSDEWLKKLGELKEKQIKEEEKELEEINSVGVFSSINDEEICNKIEDIKNYEEEGKERLNLVVSYRDREEELDEFLPHMVQYLMDKNIDFHIYVIEQISKNKFNKGYLYNVGVKYLIKNKVEGYLCFHDVDIIPIKSTNYGKPKNNSINHLYGYKFCLGGIFTMNIEDYENINGFSNRYNGWGYEDNDFLRRVMKGKMIVNNKYLEERYRSNIFREMNKDNPSEKMNLEQTKINEKIFKKDFKTEGDGIDNIDIDKIEIEECMYYTIIKVDV